VAGRTIVVGPVTPKAARRRRSDVDALFSSHVDQGRRTSDRWVSSEWIGADRRIVRRKLDTAVCDRLLTVISQIDPRREGGDFYWACPITLDVAMSGAHADIKVSLTLSFPISGRCDCLAIPATSVVVPVPGGPETTT
jgi:hypothetical protein